MGLPGWWCSLAPSGGHLRMGVVRVRHRPGATDSATLSSTSPLSQGPARMTRDVGNSPPTHQMEHLPRPVEVDTRAPRREPAATTAEKPWARTLGLWLPVPVRSPGWSWTRGNFWDPSAPPPQAKLRASSYIHSTSSGACLPGPALGPRDTAGTWTSQNPPGVYRL